MRISNVVVAAADVVYENVEDSDVSAGVAVDYLPLILYSSTSSSSSSSWHFVHETWVRRYYAIHCSHRLQTTLVIHLLLH